MMAQPVREDDECFHRFIDAAIDPMAIADSEGRLLHANRPLSQLLGYDEQELLALSIDALLPERFRADHRRNRVEFTDESHPRRMASERKVLARRKDGTEVAVEVSLSPLARGCVLARVRDISKQAHIEQALHESEARFRATFDHAAVGIAHLAPDGSVLRANRSLCTILGYREQELMAHTLNSLTDASDQNANRDLMQQLLRGERETYVHEMRLLTKLGEPVWVNLTISPVRHLDGAADYVIAVVEDIAVRKQTESMLRDMRSEIQEMLELHVATQTVKAIAHEINQPLTAISSYTEAAVRMLRTSHPEQTRILQALEASGNQAQRAGQIMRRLISFLQKGELVTEPVDLNQLVLAALAVIESDGFGGFRTELALGADTPTVAANRAQIEKILVNLMRNSVEAMANAGIPRAQMHITIRTMCDDGMAKVSVSDNGPGVSRQNARHVFEPFFTTKPRGLGMGLAICRTLVDSHGGRLWLDSDERTGASFHFTLPLAS